MGVDMIALEKPKPGHEEEFRQLILKHNPDLEPESVKKEARHWLEFIGCLLRIPLFPIYLIKALFFSEASGIMSPEETEERRREKERLKEISISPDETLATLRVGESPKADYFFRYCCYEYANLRIANLENSGPPEYVAQWKRPFAEAKKEFLGKSIGDISSMEPYGESGPILVPAAWTPAETAYRPNLKFEGLSVEVTSELMNCVGNEMEANNILSPARTSMKRLIEYVRKGSEELANEKDEEFEHLFMMLAMLAEVVDDKCLYEDEFKSRDYSKVLEELASKEQKPLADWLACYCLLKWAIFWAEKGHGHKAG